MASSRPACGTPSLSFRSPTLLLRRRSARSFLGKVREKVGFWREKDRETLSVFGRWTERERDRVLRITFLERETWFQPSTDTEGREREREAKCEESKSDARQRELRVCSYWGLMCRIITRLPLCELCICFWDLLCYAMLRLYCLVLVRPFGLCVSYDDEAI